MASTGFLYRRLARYAPCVFPQVGSGSLSLLNKYDVASMRDVFLSAHYWRVFDHMAAPPRLVVDLGAHCGHFSVLCHLAALEKFGVDSARYILVEALPQLVPQIRRVVADAGFADQVQIVQSLAGKPSGTAHLQTDSRNLLSSKTSSNPGADGPVFSYCDLDLLLQPGPADILKIDIEGSEFDLLENYRHLLQAARLLFIEVHGPTEQQEEFAADLQASGLVPLSPTIVKEHERLLCYGPAPQRAEPAS